MKCNGKYKKFCTNVPVRGVVAKAAARRRAEHSGAREGRGPLANELHVDASDDGAVALKKRSRGHGDVMLGGGASQIKW